MTNFKKTFQLGPDVTVTVRRVGGVADIATDCKWLPMENEAAFMTYKYFYEDKLFLPKLYAALTHITGSSDSSYDEFKGSFSFCFEWEVIKNDEVSTYFCNLYQYRSWIEFALYHKVSKTDPRDPQVMRQPKDGPFSDKDMWVFSVFFCTYLLESIEKEKYKPKPFVKGSDANCLLFGFYQGEYFCESYKGYEEYEQAQKNMAISKD